MFTIFTPATAEPVNLPRLFILGPGEENFSKAPERRPELQWFARSVGRAKEQGMRLAVRACFAVDGSPPSEVVVDEATEWGKFIAEALRTQNRIRTPRGRIFEPDAMPARLKPPLKESKFRCPEVFSRRARPTPAIPITHSGNYAQWKSTP
jgi:hypothetical protein